MTFQIAGPSGSREFTFASGTTTFNIAQAIDSFVRATGVEAASVGTGPTCLQSGVSLRSTMTGADSFVTVQQLNGSKPFIAAAIGIPPTLFRLTDIGLNAVPGDANCDRIVDLGDVTLVLQGWGACPLPPAMCVGDVDQNGVVNIDDLVRVISNWGATS